MNIIFACGGTGGHIFPAIAIAQAFEKKMKKNVKIFFIGSDFGMEKEIIKKNKFKFFSIPARPFLRKFTIKNLINLFFILKAIIDSNNIIKKINPYFVIGTGGYVSFPVLIASILNGKKTFIHEPNVYPGLTNKILSRFVTGITVGFDITKKFFPKNKVFWTGNPVRQNLLNIKKEFALKKLKLHENKKTILIMPGSRAAHSINKIFLNSLPKIFKEILDLQIIWMTGKNDYKIVKLKTKKYKNIKIFKFIDNPEFAYAAADAGIFRAGASTLSEIAVLKLPAILIPYPYATANHQEKNAQFFDDNEMAIVIKEKDLTEEILINNLKKILNEKINMQLRNNLKKISIMNSADKICNFILKAG